MSVRGTNQRRSKMARRSKQLGFNAKGFAKIADGFGGSNLKSHPKIKRPLDSKLPIHLVLRTSASCLRLPKLYGEVNGLVQRAARKHGVTVYSYANVGNHIHLLIKIASRGRWAPFIRELTGRIAQLARETINLAPTRPFWLFRPYTRVVRGWRTPFRMVKDYLHLNRLEADGFISRSETNKLKDLRALWSG